MRDQQRVVHRHIEVASMGVRAGISDLANESAARKLVVKGDDFGIELICLDHYD